MGSNKEAMMLVSLIAFPIGVSVAVVSWADLVPLFVSAIGALVSLTLTIVLAALWLTDPER